jgi:hypothetical protein
VTAASPTPGSSSALTHTVQVRIETEADVEARKRKEEEDELSKRFAAVLSLRGVRPDRAYREANAQPAWFAKSTLEQERPPTPATDGDRLPIKLEGEGAFWQCHSDST